MTTTFRQANVNFAPNVTPTSIDPDNIQANPLNEDIAAYTFNSADPRHQLRQGSRHRRRRQRPRRRSARRRRVDHLPEGRRQVPRQGQGPQPQRDHLSPRRAAADDRLPRQPASIRRRISTAATTCMPFISQAKVAADPVAGAGRRARRTTRATPRSSTAPSDGRRSMRWRRSTPARSCYLLPGVRYEYTASDFTGRDVLFSPSGAYLLDHARAVNDQLRRRAAGVSRAVRRDAEHQHARRGDALARAAELLRPGAVRVAQRRGQHRQRSATPTCSPTTSWNVDVLGEHYFKSVGVVSAGVFYKRLKDYIYIYTLRPADQRHDLSRHAAAQRRRGDDSRRRAGAAESADVPARRRSTASASTPTTRSAIRPRRFRSTPATARCPASRRHVGNVAVVVREGRLPGPRRR